MKTEYLDLYEKLQRLQWLMQKNRVRNRKHKGPMDDTLRGQGRVLSMLNLQPDISTKMLSFLLGIRPQSLNELLTKLEKNEYITRTPSEEDKRVILVRLTEKGENALPKGSEVPNIFTSLNQEEMDNLADYLDRIIVELEEKVEALDEDREKQLNEIREKLGDEQFEKFMGLQAKQFGLYGRGFAKRKHHKHGHCCKEKSVSEE
jgi:Transcriptional regulators